MSMFSKPKGPPATLPARCERCGERPPTVHLHMMRPPGRDDAAPHDLWLCGECVEALKREANDN